MDNEYSFYCGAFTAAQQALIASKSGASALGYLESEIKYADERANDTEEVAVALGLSDAVKGYRLRTKDEVKRFIEESKEMFRE